MPGTCGPRVDPRDPHAPVAGRAGAGGPPGSGLVSVRERGWPFARERRATRPREASRREPESGGEAPAHRTPPLDGARRRAVQQVRQLQPHDRQAHEHDERLPRHRPRHSAGSQVYRGRLSEHPNGDAAVAGTTGLVTSYEGRIISAFYSSSMAGNPENVEWSFSSVGDPSNARPYLVGHDGPAGTEPDLTTEAGRRAFWEGAAAGARQPGEQREPAQPLALRLAAHRLRAGAQRDPRERAGRVRLDHEHRDASQLRHHAVVADRSGGRRPLRGVERGVGVRELGQRPSRRRAPTRAQPDDRRDPHLLLQGHGDRVLPGRHRREHAGGASGIRQSDRSGHPRAAPGRRDRGAARRPQRHARPHFSAADLAVPVLRIDVSAHLVPGANTIQYNPQGKTGAVTALVEVYR